MMDASVSNNEFSTTHSLIGFCLLCEQHSDTFIGFLHLHVCLMDQSMNILFPKSSQLTRSDFQLPIFRDHSALFKLQCFKTVLSFVHFWLTHTVFSERICCCYDHMKRAGQLLTAQNLLYMQPSLEITLDMQPESFDFPWKDVACEDALAYQCHQLTKPSCTYMYVLQLLRS